MTIKITTYRVYIIHLLLWVLFFSMVNVDWTSNWLDASLRPQRPAPLSVLALPVFFYLNASYLIPRFLSVKGWYRYLLAAVTVFLGAELLRIGITYLVLPEGRGADFFWKSLTSRDSFLFTNLSPGWVALLLSFAYRFTTDWFVNRQRIERLEADQLRKELAMLKAQLNPHFLFNNLNTLDGLIDVDPERAKTYLHRLSGIYRYLLTRIEQEWVPLEEELAFAKDYLFILETRFGTIYRFEILPNTSGPGKWLIPPASLQTVLENVVKHNQGDPEKPLLTTLRRVGNTFEVSNEKRPKLQPADRLGTGLANLNNRYVLLGQPEIRVANNSHFTVTLPLIPQSP